MHVLALAADYDNTLAFADTVDAATLESLQRLKASGRKLILVTGRILAELLPVFPGYGICDRIVAENGAQVFDPQTRRSQLLACPPPPLLVQRLRNAGVQPLAVGETIIATHQPNEGIVLDVIRELGLEYNIIFNKGAVMLLPGGINKASGLRYALQELDISRHAAVGVGDAENDHSFLALCGSSAAVANALASVKERANLVLDRVGGAGVQQLVDKIIENDAGLTGPGQRGLAVGTDAGGGSVLTGPTQGHVLVAGPSGAGKSAFATALTERMIEQEFEFCVFDPEGDYSMLRGAVPVGAIDHAPDEKEVVDLISKAAVNVVVHLHALAPDRRRGFLERLWPEIQALKAVTGRPNWMIVDEAHQTFPATDGRDLSADFPPSVFLTVDPESLSSPLLAAIESLCAFGPDAGKIVAAFCRAAGLPEPATLPEPGPGEILLWRPRTAQPAEIVRLLPHTQIHRRHAGKYAEGDVGIARSFYFRGPDGRCAVRARNLFEFMRLADQVDDAVWNYHLYAHDYSRWFRDVIRDSDLAQEIAPLQKRGGLSPAETRAAIRTAILDRYSPTTASEAVAA